MGRIGAHRAAGNYVRSVIPWYLAGDAAPTVAFQPFYAQSAAYSLVNKANPGTANAYATPGGFTVPALTVGAGWLGAVSRSLSCDVTITESSCIVALANVTGAGGADYGNLCRSASGTMRISPNTADFVGYYNNSSGISFPSILGLATIVTIGKAIYINGVYSGTAPAGSFTESSLALTNSGAIDRYLGGTLAAFAIYDSLTLQQASAIRRALLDQYANPLPHTTKVITAIGDSITAATSSWETRTAEMYNESFTTVNQRALVGARIMYELDTYVAAAVDDNADVVIVQMGVNDDNGGDMTALQAKVEENLAELKASNRNASIYWMFLPAYEGTTEGDPLVAKGNIRTAIAAGCAAQGISYWDTLSDPWILPTDTSDGWHPTAAGHQKIADRVVALLA